MKTIICDIDGTLLEHHGDIKKNVTDPPVILPGVAEAIHKWDVNNHRIILVTGRKESTRAATEKQLFDAGIVFDDLIMGLPNGDRVLLNDRKPEGKENTAYAINVVRNDGLENVDVDSFYRTIPDRSLYDRVEKPWGYEELLECNDKYVVKKLFMKEGHSCSLQYHRLKTESILVHEGTLWVRQGNDLEAKPIAQGGFFTIRPYTYHRMEARTGDVTYYETSTNELWDVVRVEDVYGRK